MSGIEIIVCEGVSEVAYVRELNRLLWRNDYGYLSTAFHPVCAFSGHFGPLKKAFKAAQTANKGCDIAIWADFDIYQRNDLRDGDQYRSRRGLPEFLFSVMNFEDFLMMHCEPAMLDDWLAICQDHHHFAAPMHAEEYEPLIRQFWPTYRKGELPFMLTRSRLEQLFSNLDRHNPLIRNDFGSHVKNEVTTRRLVFA